MKTAARATFHVILSGIATVELPRNRELSNCDDRPLSIVLRRAVRYVATLAALATLFSLHPSPIDSVVVTFTSLRISL